MDSLGFEGSSLIYTIVKYQMTTPLAGDITNGGGAWFHANHAEIIESMISHFDVEIIAYEFHMISFDRFIYTYDQLMKSYDGYEITSYLFIP